MGPSRLQIKDNLLYTLHSGSFFPHSHNTLRRPRKQVFFKKPHTSSFPFYCPQWCSSFIKSVLHATINQISVFDLVQNPSVCGILLLQLSPALKHWHGNPASLPSVCSPAKVDLGQLVPCFSPNTPYCLYSCNPRLLDSCFLPHLTFNSSSSFRDPPHSSSHHYFGICSKGVVIPPIHRALSLLSMAALPAAATFIH